MKTGRQRPAPVGFIVMCDGSALHWGDHTRFYRGGGSSAPVTLFASRRQAQSHIKKSAQAWRAPGDMWSDTRNYWVVRVVAVSKPEGR